MLLTGKDGGTVSQLGAGGEIKVVPEIFQNGLERSRAGVFNSFVMSTRSDMNGISGWAMCVLRCHFRSWRHKLYKGHKHD